MNSARKLIDADCIKMILRKYNLDPRIGSRRFGQHFLADAQSLQRIIDYIDPMPNERIVEIGPGIGALTGALIERGARVIAIEVDPRLKPILDDLGRTHQGMEVWWGDALSDSMMNRIIGSDSRVVGNVAYDIASQLITRLFCRPTPRPPEGVFLIQREVAQRLAAPEGSAQRGALSVCVQACAHIEQLFDVSPSSFWPQPKVRGSVIRVRSCSHPLVDYASYGAFCVFVQSCFHARRKTIQSNVTALLEKSAGIPGGDRPACRRGGESITKAPHAFRDTVQDILSAASIDSSLRPQALSQQQWKRLFEVIHKNSISSKERFVV